MNLPGARHEVLTAASGLEAPERLEQDRRFDVVFCDLMTTRMSGLEPHAGIVEHDCAPAEPVVFMTGGAFMPRVSACPDSMENLRTHKPFDVSNLEKMTDEVVVPARVRKAGAAPRDPVGDRSRQLTCAAVFRLLASRGASPGG